MIQERMLTHDKGRTYATITNIFAKIPRHTSQNAITEGDLECILTRNCEGTEQLRNYHEFICPCNRR